MDYMLRLTFHLFIIEASIAYTFFNLINRRLNRTSNHSILRVIIIIESL